MADRIDPENSCEIESKDNSDRRASPLGELIAEIDQELQTGSNLISDRSEVEKSPEKHLTDQRQYIKFLLHEIVLTAGTVGHVIQSQVVSQLVRHKRAHAG